MCYQ
ncbi:hypothetical protein D047_0654A, partial [Vibrio parahaemolyticus VPTS-2010_2]